MNSLAQLSGDAKRIFSDHWSELSQRRHLWAASTTILAISSTSS